MTKTICMDLRPLQIGHQNRGIGMHIRSILENLPESDDIYLFYCFDSSDPIEDLNIQTRVNYKIVQTPVIDTALDSPEKALGIFKLVWHRFSALKKHRPDTFVQFDFMLGMPRWRGLRKVIIGYDLIPYIMQNEYRPSLPFAWNHARGKKAKIRALLRAVYYRFRYWIHYKVFLRADKVVCISQATADSFHELLGVPKSKLEVSYLAPVGSTTDIDSSTAKTIDKPYIFYIGGTDARKSISDIVHAYNIARGRGQDIALVLAGNEFRNVESIPDVKGRNAIIDSPYSSDIHLVGFVTDQQKNGLYKDALVFVFASRFEGFGLPVIEAMSASCPVISYNNSSIPEVAGDAAILVRTGSVVEVASSIVSLSDKDARRELAHKGTVQSKKFTWSRHVSGLLSVIGN